MTITLANDTDSTEVQTATFYVFRRNEAIAKIDLAPEPFVVTKATVSVSGNTLHATALSEEVPDPADPCGVGNGTQSVDAEIEQGTHTLALISPTPEGGADQTLTLRNKTGFPIQFVLAPDDGSTPAQIFTVGEHSAMPINLSGQFQAYAHVRGFESWPDKAPETDTDKVSFYSDGAELTLRKESHFTFFLAVSE